MENKKNYYVFLDIDGTLYDAKHCSNYDPEKSLFKYYPLIDKYSMKAVNFLLSKLDEQYNPVLVIISERRKDMDSCAKYLYSSGLIYDKPLLCTTLDKNLSRGEQIIQFMKSVGEGPFNYTKKSLAERIKYAFKKEDFSNFVVLDDDDENNKLTNLIHKSRIIFSDHHNQSITKQQIKEYLSRNNLLSQPKEFE